MNETKYITFGFEGKYIKMARNKTDNNNAWEARYHDMFNFISDGVMKSSFEDSLLLWPGIIES